MHTPDPTPTVRNHQPPATDATGEQDIRNRAELTGEEKAALAVHQRHIFETSYLPAPADYLHVR